MHAERAFVVTEIADQRTAYVLRHTLSYFTNYKKKCVSKTQSCSETGVCVFRVRSFGLCYMKFHR
jgi:hypothetical protein